MKTMRMIKPKMGEAPIARGVTAIGLTFAMAFIPNPTITTIRDIHSAENIDVNITTVLGTAVT